MSQNLKQYQQQASYYRAALLLGLISGDAVVSWADSIIARDSDAPSAMFDVAMVAPSDLSELRHALQPLSARGESPLIVRALFDIVARDLSSSARSAHDTVTVLAQARRFLTLPGEHFEEIDTLQDDYMLAGAGVVGNKDAVEARVRDWLAQFAGGEAAFLEESACSNNL